MKKYWIWQWISSWFIWKLNKKWDQRLDKEELSDNEIMSLFESMWRYIKQKTWGNWNTIVIKSWGKEIISFKVY